MAEAGDDMERLRSNNAIQTIIIAGIFCILAFGYSANTARADISSNKTNYTIATSLSKDISPTSGDVMEDQLFFSVPLNSYSSTTCSPEFSERSGKGLLIAAPSVIDITRHSVFPLCGTLRLKARLMASLGDDPIEATVIVVVNMTENESMSFNLKPDKEPVEEEGHVVLIDTDEYDEHDVRENYFNIDLRTFSQQLDSSLTPGFYAIYAVLESYKSNTIKVHVVDKGDTH